MRPNSIFCQLSQDTIYLGHSMQELWNKEQFHDKLMDDTKTKLNPQNCVILN